MGIDKNGSFLLNNIYPVHQRCTTANGGSSLYGTCISTSECTSRSGSASGTCAAGFGVCCKYWINL